MSLGTTLRPVLWITIVLVGLGLSTPGVAADRGPEAFFGRYQGSGITQSPNVAFYGFTDRDLDVQIGPDEKGFFVEWTTVIRDWRDTETRRNTSRISFEPSGRPGIYIERAAAMRVADGLSWATIRGETLSVRVLAILDDGAYEVHSYDRSLSENGLFLYFRSDRDGQVIRVVTASLKKAKE